MIDRGCSTASMLLEEPVSLVEPLEELKVLVLADHDRVIGAPAERDLRRIDFTMNGSTARARAGTS